MILKNDAEGFRQVATALLNGENVCIPTDTVYGLAASARNIEAVRRIFSLKGRDEKKPLAMLVGSVDMARRYIKSSIIAERLMEKFWPGALTIVAEKSDFSKNDDVIKIATGEGDLIGVRFPKSELIKEIISMIDAPIFATSVNFSGEEPLNTPSDIQAKFVSLLGADMIILERNGEDFDPISSTVVEIQNDDMRILRHGGITDQIADFFTSK